MAKQYFKPGNMLYPLPAVMVSCQYPAGKEDALCTNPALAGKPNIITVAWAGTVCTNPPMLSISVRPERYSYHMIEESGEFVVNLTTEQLVRATDFCGVRSGKDIDKFKEMHLTPLPSKEISAPGIAESPVNIECKVREIKPLGSHTMFLADVVNVTVDDKFFDKKNTFHLNDTGGWLFPAWQKTWHHRIWCCKKESKETEITAVSLLFSYIYLLFNKSFFASSIAFSTVPCSNGFIRCA